MSGFVNYLKNSWVAACGRRPEFKDREEFYAAVEGVIKALRAAGCEASSDSVKEGFSCLNGLTDGWALFLDHLEKAESQLPPGAPAAEKTKLGEITYAARYSVYHPRG